MNSIKNLPLRVKLLFIILGTTFLALSIAFTVIVINDIDRLKEELVSNTKINAKLIGEYCIGPIAFEDYASLQTKVLVKAQNIPNIESAQIIKEDSLRNTIAHFGSNAAFTNVPIPTGKDTIFHTEHSLHIVHKIEHAGEVIASIHLQCSKEGLQEKINKEIILFIVLLLGILILTFLLANYFQKLIASPILKLASVSKQITTEGNYSIHLHKKYNDEIGQLYENFNEMINQIKNRADARDAAIKQAEESKARLGLVLDSVSEGYWDWDLIKGEIFFSDKWLSSLGYVREEIEPSLRFYEQLIHSEDLSLVKSSRELHFDSETKFYECEFRILRKNGEYRWTLDRGRVVQRDERGRPTRMVGTNVDISVRKDAEKTQTLLEAQLRQAKKMETIGTLAGGISHDFKNILTPILGFTDLVMQTLPETHEVQEDLQKILTAARRANELVNQILTFSRQTEAEKRPINLNQIIEESIPLLRATIPTTIDIDLDISSNSSFILADETQIQQVIMNLCTNAYHAMEELGGSMSVKLSEKEFYESQTLGSTTIEPGKYVVLKVADSGKGISKENIDRIFDPFFTSKKVGKGTGLGLSVVHGVITKQRGVIHVESEIDFGTTFTIYLPYYDKGDEHVSAPVRVSNSIRGEEKILVVDDEEINAFVLKRMLSNLGYKITFTADSEEAAQMIKTNPKQFDLIITDQTMPRLTGLELASIANEVRANFPVIIITGSMELIHQKEKYTQVRDILVKPFEINDINRAIRKILDN